jgi:hypothetical protein
MLSAAHLRRWFNAFDSISSGHIPAKDVRKIVQLMLIVVPPGIVDIVTAKHATSGLVTFFDLEAVMSELSSSASPFSAASIAAGLELYGESNHISSEDFNHIKRVLTGTGFDTNQLKVFFDRNSPIPPHELACQMTRLNNHDW